jgi:hypothetical protein
MILAARPSRRAPPTMLAPVVPLIGLVRQIFAISSAEAARPK